MVLVGQPGAAEGPNYWINCHRGPGSRCEYIRRGGVGIQDREWASGWAGRGGIDELRRRRMAGVQGRSRSPNPLSGPVNRNICLRASRIKLAGAKPTVVVFLPFRP